MKRYNTMPMIDMNKLQSILDDHEKKIAEIIVKKDGFLRKSAPKYKQTIKTDELDHRVYGIDEQTGKTIESTFSVYRFADQKDELLCESKIVWRLVAFYCSQRGKDRCMPWGLEFDNMFGTKEEQTARLERLNKTVDKFLSVIPLREQHGLIAWGKAFGML